MNTSKASINIAATNSSPAFLFPLLRQTFLFSAPIIAPATTAWPSSFNITFPIALNSPPTTFSLTPPPGARSSANSSITSTAFPTRSTPSAPAITALPAKMSATASS